MLRGRVLETSRARCGCRASRPSVPAVRVTRADLSGTITLTGEFIPFQEVDVMAKVAGYIRAINVDVGDRVHQGQVLATLEVPEMEDDLTRAAAAIEQANPKPRGPKTTFTAPNRPMRWPISRSRALRT